MQACPPVYDAEAVDQVLISFVMKNVFVKNAGKPLLAIAYFLSFTFLSFSQTQNLQLLDPADGSPIVGATFRHAEQTGLSDEQGVIRFERVAGENLALSHLSYGRWQLMAGELQQALEAGFTYRGRQTESLYPVTVIALRPRAGRAETLKLEFEDRLAHDGGAILNRTPGVNTIRKAGNYGFDPVMRGFKYDQLNVVLNGAQAAVAACPNRMDPPTSQMTPNMTDRIEILKGPHALRFGSAFGGTINFIPPAPRFSEENEVYGRWSGGYESNGGVVRSEGLLGFSGKRYDLGLFASWSQGNDYTDGDGRSVPADFQRGSFGLNLDYQLADRQLLSLSATRNLARDADFPALPMDLREDDTWMFNARHDITFASGKLESWNTTLFGTFVDHLMDNLLKPLDPRMLNARTAAETLTWGGRTEGIWNFSQSRLFFGADLRVEEARGSRERAFLLGPNAGRTFTDNAWQNGRISKSAVFAEYHLGRGPWQWTFSGRLELNRADIRDASEEFLAVYPQTDITQLNPSVSLGVVRELDSEWKAGLWLGRAQRSGSLTERFINYFPVGLDPFEMLGNPQLDPEINNQLDLNLSYRSGKDVLQVDLFTAYLQDYISGFIDSSLTPRLPMSPGVRPFTNIGDAFKTGFELSWSRELFKGLRQQFSVAYTYGQDLEREQPLPEIAPLDLRYTLSGMLLKERLQPEVSLRQVLRQGRVSEEFGETITPAFTLLDVNLAYRVSDWGRLSAGVQNLFDATYYEHLNRSVRGNMPRPIFAPGRNVYVSASVEF